MDSQGTIRFDGWTLQRASGELLKNGRRIRLADQALRLLEALLDAPGRVVTREQLIARLWPKGVVEFDTSLNAAVRKLRAALGDEADTPRYIETLPRKGYRFISEVSSESLPTALPARMLSRSGPADQPVGESLSFAPTRVTLSRPCSICDTPRDSNRRDCRSTPISA
jgi:DNA-binding winged helix-turn-helix (wHTH) protein